MPPDRLIAALADRYRIERELGAGGMATVYLAADLKHERKVALKVLKPELAAVLGADRFVQEIKTTAALQHPHILPLFDSGSAAGFLYYVMPYVEGETLRDRLRRDTQLGIEESVRITREVADALDYAHRHGVIHRDIKPENILLHDGRPMVADFGIALAVSAAAGGRMTETGLSLGTPHYMSPEQATADKDITARSDVYSLASVLYEMLAGEPPHMGNSAQQIIMKIIAEPAQPVTKFRRSVPPNVASAVATALEKLPADRFATAKAFADALDDSAYATKATARLTSDAGSQRGWRAIALAASVVAAGAVLAMVVTRGAAPVEKTLRVTIPFPSATRLISYNISGFDIDRSGTRVAYVAADGPFALWVRDLGDLAPREIPNTTGATAPAFSPDGEYIAFAGSGAGARVTSPLRVVPMVGGAAVTLVADSVARFAPHWGDDGNIYFTHYNGRLARVRAEGGDVQFVSKLDGVGDTTHRFPQLLPGGESLLLIASGLDGGDDQLAVMDVESGEIRHLFAGLNGRYIESGHVVFADAEGSLFAVPFDPGRGEVTGPRIALTDKAYTGGFARFVASLSGVIVYQPTFGASNYQLTWVDRSGNAVPIDTAWRGDLRGPALAPDGSRLAVTVTAGAQTQLWVKELPGGPRTLVSSGNRMNVRARWMRDSRQVSFLSGTGVDDAAVVARRFDASDSVRTLVPASDWNEIEWLPGGQSAVLRRGSRLGTRDLYLMTLGDGAPKPLLTTDQDDYAPAVSPDGLWMAYVSTESGRPEVNVRLLSDPSGGRKQVSLEGGGPPVWAHSGRELFFRGLDGGTMMVADVTTGATFSSSTPRLLFDRPEYRWEPFVRGFDISRDDRRFLMVSAPPSVTNELVVVLNLGAELRERARARSR